MREIIISSPFFGLGLTLVCWAMATALQRKTKLLILSPNLTSFFAIIALLSFFRISYAEYMIGANLIHAFLPVVTTALALNIYRQRAILKEYFFPILIGCFVGSVTSLASVFLLCKLFTMPDFILNSLLPKSVTTAIAIGIAESRGGIGGIATTGVMISGLLGAAFSPLFAKILKITDPVSQGIAMGACAHALGTAKAMELGQLHGAMSSIALCTCGIITSFVIMFF